MRSPIRRPALAAAVVAAGLAAAGCGGGNGMSADDATAPTAPQEVLLQPAAAQGPDPFTESTARKSAETVPAPSTDRSPSPVSSTSPVAQELSSIPGSAPGLYGGTHSVAGCDVERQVHFLTEDSARRRVFAQVSRVDPNGVPGYLRGLTPVVLRADTRVTNHGYTSGTATGFQAVLQAGTAVLVDAHGAPRVRCACGNPLLPPTSGTGKVMHRGQPWAGYRPDRVAVVKPVTRPIDVLMIVDVVNNTWIERRVGDDCCQDRTSDAAPSPPPPSNDVLPPPPGGDGAS